MSQTSLNGIIHGKTIELEQESGFPDGQRVVVVVSPTRKAGDGVKKSAGAWSDAGDDFDAWLDEVRRSRQVSRMEP